MSSQIAYGVFCCTAYDGLTTPDKQLHIGPCLIRGSMSEHWEGLINTLLWLQEQIPQHTFTLVIDELSNFDNPFYWSRNKMYEFVLNPCEISREIS